MLAARWSVITRFAGAQPFGPRAAIALTAITLVAVLCAASLLVLFTTDPTMVWTRPGFRGAGELNAIVFGLVGYFIAIRRPRLLVGWLALGSAVSTAAYVLTFELVFRLHGSADLAPGDSLNLSAAALPWATFGVWLRYWISEPGLFAQTLILPVFPSGPLRARRWRIALGTQVGLGVVATLVGAFTPWRNPTTGIGNPVGVAALAALAPDLTPITSFLLLASLALGVASLIVRYRAGATMPRQQIKWVTAAMSLYLPLAVIRFVDQANGAYALQTPISLAELVIGTFVAPAAVAIAMLRYRLFDIDLIINRALVYGGVSAFLAGAFAGLSTAAQYILRAMTGERSEIVSILLAVLATVAFAPLRTRVQTFVDRRMKEGPLTPMRESAR
jgi:two-component system NarL family sensor kinase